MPGLTQKAADTFVLRSLFLRDWEVAISEKPRSAGQERAGRESARRSSEFLKTKQAARDRSCLACYRNSGCFRRV